MQGVTTNSGENKTSDLDIKKNYLKSLAGKEHSDRGGLILNKKYFRI